MIVSKFGGTSLADARCFLDRVEIVRERAEDGCLVVASAMAGVSRALLQLAWTTQTDGIEAALPLRDAIVERHHEVLQGAGIAGDARNLCEAAIDEEGRRIAELLGPGTPGERILAPARDRILAAGELLSSRLLAAALNERGVRATWIDPRELVASDDGFGGARYDAGRTRANVEGRLRPVTGPGQVVVTGGFIARAPTGATTTLGWGASDTSATLLGSCVGASLVEIWTDVDGIATADPRLVEDARTIPLLSFEEACDLTFFGAQVLHYSAIDPVRRAGIPLRVRNSFRPEHAGTLIRAVGDGWAPEASVRGLSLAGPMAPPEMDALAGCGVHAIAAEPPWALVKGRTFPFDSPEGPGDALSLLTAVGGGLDDSAAIRAVPELLGDLAPAPLPSPCATHRTYRIGAERAGGALRTLHATVFAAG